MASLQALAAFLPQQGPYHTFSQIALSISDSAFQNYFDGRDLTLIVPSDDAFSNGSSNARGYNFNISDTTLMWEVLLYHIVPGMHDLYSGPSSDMHILLPTARSADLDKNQPQQLVVQNGLIFLNQRVSPKLIDRMGVNKTVIYCIDTVLGFPSTYSWEANNTGLMEEWKSFEAVSGGFEVDDYDGITVFAPADGTWTVQKFVNQIPTGQLRDVYDNHVIPGVTVWSPNFMNGTYTSASGFNYTFNQTSSGHFTVTLNGTTVSITRSDILTWNGVIHLLDGPLWADRSISESGPNSSSAAAPSTTSGTSPTTSLPNADRTEKAGLTTGTVAGIAIAAAVALVSATIVLYGLWRRRQRHIKVLERKEGSIDGPDLPTTALRTSPFTSSNDLTRGSRSLDNATPDVSARSISPAMIEKRSIQSNSFASTSNAFPSSERLTC
ncbi:hypothetical protein BDY19DRAFT_961662, partial [Irpex rosettiformis]